MEGIRDANDVGIGIVAEPEGDYVQRSTTGEVDSE